MAEILKTILENIGENGAFFVFPSAVAAESRAREVCGMRGPAVDMRRFIAWDRFKAQVFSPGVPGKVPAQRTVRRLFALSVLRDNSENPFLGNIIRPEYREHYGKFAGMVERALPSIGLLSGLKGDIPRNGELSDWSAISLRYDAFLEKFGYFEPSRHSPDPASLNFRYFIFHTELIEDFSVFRLSLEALPDVFLLRPGKERGTPKLFCFDAAAAEIRWVLRRISALLDSGVKPSSIAVTVPDWPAWRPYFERDAALYDVPLSVKAGKPLSEWTAGRFFRAINRCVAENWSFGALKALVLDGAWPFRKTERERAFNFLKCGTACHAVAPWTEDGARVDLWEKTFAAGVEKPGLDMRDALAFYRSVRKNAEAIRHAETFRTIADKFGRFENVFFDREGWGPNGKVIERALVILTELALVEEKIGLHPGIDRFPAFLDYLDSVPYVYRTAETGVAVYPWRVSAGIAAPHRFVMNAAQGSVSVRYPELNFLSLPLGSLLAGAPSDATEAFIGAYASMPSGGQETVFTFSAKGPEGERVPHSAFFSGRISMGKENPDYAAFKASDPLAGERAAWSGRSSEAVPLPFQVLSWETTGARGPFSATCSWIQGSGGVGDERVRESLASLVRDKDGYIKLSDTFVETWIQCPFKALLEQVLRFQEIRSGIDFADSLFIGSALHEIAKNVFGRIGECSEAFDSCRLVEYREFVRPAVLDAVQSISRKDGAFLAPVLECFVPLFGRMMDDLLEYEAELRPGWKHVIAEGSITRKYEAEKIKLTGTIDRVSRKGDNLFVVDYKKGKASIPSFAKFREALSELGEIREKGMELPVFLNKPFQLPVYAELLDPGKGDDIECGYWAFTERKFRKFIDTADESEKKALGTEGLFAAQAAFRKLMFETNRGLNEGEYRMNSRKRELACLGCGLHAVCRKGFAI